MILIISILLIAGYCIIDHAIRPSIFSMAEARLDNMASQAMVDAMRESLGNDIENSDLINVEKDKSGKITLITTNAVLINKLVTDATLKAQQKILDIGEQGISIPIGTLIGGQLLSGRGPSVQVKIEPVGSVTPEFRSEFEDAGINQTRHRIILILSAAMKIIIGNEVEQVNTTSQVLISDTIIVGDIPETYLEPDNMDGLMRLVPMMIMDKFSEDNADN